MAKKLIGGRGKGGKGKRCTGFTPIDMFGSPVEFNINGDTSYKTVVGCFWTLVMAGLMIAATVYYFIQYLDKSNVTLTSQSVQLTSYPTMDFKAKGLFLVLLFQKGPQNFLKPGNVNRYFSVEAVQITQESSQDASTSERTPKPPTVTKVKLDPCKPSGVTAKVNGKDIKGKTSMAVSDFGYCVILNDTDTQFTLAGDQDSDVFKYVQIRIFPCEGTFGPMENSTNTQCALPNAYSPSITFTQNEEKRIRDSLRDYSVTVMLIDTAIDAVNYEDPIIYMMNGNYRYYLASLQQKQVGFYFKTVNVQTDTGILSENWVEHQSFSIGEVIYDAMDRGVTDRLLVKNPPPLGETTRPLPYGTFTFYSSNTKLEYTRTYMKILDVLALVGGVSQVFTYAVIVLYAWYNSMKMEQEIINKTVLHINKDDDELEDWEKERRLSIWDIFKFHYFSACQKKNPKYKLYKNCESQVDDKTDITKIIQAVTDIEVLKKAILTPAQSKLIRYTALAQPEEKKEDEDQEEEKEKELSPNEAIKILMAEPTGRNEIVDRINKYILENMPKESGLVKSFSNLNNLFAGKSQQRFSEGR
jgi:hypothetical protein